MVAYAIIYRLEKVVAEFLNGETYGNIASDSTHKRELERLFDNSTQSIADDLEAEYEALLFEDYDIALNSFKQEMKNVQERVELLKGQFEAAAKLSFDIEDNKAREQYLFCKRMVVFLNDLIERVEEWREGALTSEEDHNTYFTSVKYDRQELTTIYNRLVEHRWIDRRTPLRAFLYYFTGEGLKPTKPIRWLPDITALTLFLERMTFENKKKWAKAAKIFEKEGAKMSRKTLSVSYDRVYDEEIKREICDELDRKIFKGM